MKSKKIPDYEKLKEQRRKMQERAFEKAKEKQKALIEDRKKNPEKYYKKPKLQKPIKSKQKTARKLKEPYASIFCSDMSMCYITGSRNSVCPHHIFYGPDKTFSEKYHFMLPLRSDWHTGSNYAIHNNRKFDLEMKIKCQEYWINTLGKTKDDWHKEGVQWHSESDFEKIA